MLKYIYSMFWTEAETNSLCPHSFSPMPLGKFHNFAIEVMPHDDDGDYIIDIASKTSDVSKDDMISVNEVLAGIVNKISIDETSVKKNPIDKTSVENISSEEYLDDCDV